jgi:SAM-dependent methyltransferase
MKHACLATLRRVGGEESGSSAGRRGGAFYDQPGVLERYHERPGDISNPVVVMEEPAVLDELGEVAGLRVLDLGCGEGALGRVLLERGCRSYLGIDGSARMVDVARGALRDAGGRVERADIEDFATSPGELDLVVSRLALHYVEDVEAVLAAAHGWLSPGGRIVITVVHPVITSHDARETTDQLRADWVVDGYFTTGPREQRWLGGAVTWHHRTVEEYVTALQRAGFTLSTLGECPPRPERFGSGSAELDRRRRIPMFLLLAGAR